MSNFFHRSRRTQLSTDFFKPCLQWIVVLVIFDLNIKLVSTNELFQQRLNTIKLQSCRHNLNPSVGLHSTNGRNTVKIPANLTSRGDNDLIFGIDENNGANLPCNINYTVLKVINWSDGQVLPSRLAPKRTLTNVSNSNLSLLPLHFTSDGHFYDQNFYYQRSDYCIQYVSDKKMEIKICPIDCNSPSSICIPKCCGIDEVLLYWKKECKKLTESEIEDENEPQWRPVIFIDTKQTMLKYQYESTNKPESKQLHFQRQSLSEKCGENDFIEPLTMTTVVHPVIEDMKLGDDPVRLIADTNGNVQVQLYHLSKRKWAVESQGFCVDGYFVKGPGELATYQANPDHQVILQCKPKDSSAESSNSVMRSWAYGVVGIFSSFFLLVTVIIYLILLEKQNTHGLTRLSYTGSMLASFVLASSGHFISLFPHGTGVFDRGWFCVTIGVSLHYFFLANYIWLTIMNFDLWITFRTMAVRDKFKKGLRFAYYSLVGWGLPLGLVVAFIIADEVYRDPFDEVVVPDYGRPTCFVSPEFRGEYVYMPMGIVLAFNVVLIFFTMRIFYDARKQSSRIFEGGKTTASNKYSAKLFAKLFVVMGGTSIVDFLTWYYNNDSGKPWIVVILECITYLVPVVLFCLFCLNKQTFAQLQEKFPGIKSSRYSSILNRLGCFVEKKEQQESQQTTSTDDERINLNQRGTNVDSSSQKTHM